MKKYNLFANRFIYFTIFTILFVFITNFSVFATSLINHEHTFDDWHDYNISLHVRYCDCGEAEYENHQFGDWKIIIEATTETEGYKQHSCSICTLTEYEEIPKLVSQNPAQTHEHTFDDIWLNYNAHLHSHTCSCGYAEYENHTFDSWNIIQEATTEQEGYKQRACTVCSLTQIEPIEQLETEELTTEELTTEELTTEEISDEINDEIKFNVFIPIGIAVIALVLLIITVILKKR